MTDYYYDIELELNSNNVQNVINRYKKRYKLSKDLFDFYDIVLDKPVRDHPCLNHSSSCVDNVECIKKIKQDKDKEDEDNETAKKELYKAKNIDYTWQPDNLKADISKKYSKKLFSRNNIINSSGCVICDCNYGPMLYLNN